MTSKKKPILPKIPKAFTSGPMPDLDEVKAQNFVENAPLQDNGYIVSSKKVKIEKKPYTVYLPLSLLQELDVFYGKLLLNNSKKTKSDIFTEALQEYLNKS